MNAVLHTKTLIWFGNCRPQKESNKGKSACNNHCSGNAADSSWRVLSTASGKSHVRNATLQLSSFQMEGNSLERWILLHRPKIWVLQLGGANSGLYLPPQGALHMVLSRDLAALPGLVLTTGLVMFRFKLKENLRSDSFSKTTHKVLPFTSKQTQCKAVKIPASKQGSKEDMAEQKPALGTFTHIYMSLLHLTSKPDRPKNTNFHRLPTSKPATGS